jgi:hypothetical protein
VNKTTEFAQQPTDEPIVPHSTDEHGVRRLTVSDWSHWVLIAVIAVAVFFVGYSTGTIRVPVPVQPLVSQPATPITGNNENQLEKLELQQVLLRDSLERNIKQYENLLTYFAVIVSLMAGFQAYLAQRHATREQERHEIQNRMEEQGVGRVSKILDVVEKTLTFRLTAENEISEFRTNSSRINQFFEAQQSIIRRQRNAIEDAAKTLVTVRRQTLRTMISALDMFARDYDTFQQQYADLEKNNEGKKGFSARVEYIRGIAAHFANEPTLANKHLGKVTKYPTREGDEDSDLPYRKRMANAFYYIGLNLANINDPGAIE